MVFVDEIAAPGRQRRRVDCITVARVRVDVVADAEGLEQVCADVVFV
jgi:hypothetical protein